jgi:hypothetical protein
VCAVHAPPIGAQFRYFKINVSFEFAFTPYLFYFCFLFRLRNENKKNTTMAIAVDEGLWDKEGILKNGEQRTSAG